MHRVKVHLVLVLFTSFFFSFIPASKRVSAQDLVATESLSSGSSAFVFRESRKKPQVGGAGGAGRISLTGGQGGGGRARSARSKTSITTAASKRRAAAIAARKRAATAANRKIALSNTLTVKAEEFLDSDQTDLAITNYRAALAQNAKNTRASEGLSNALTAKGIEVAGDKDNLAAVVFFDEAVKLDAKNDAAYAKLGAIYDANGQNEKAIENYEKAVTLNPDFSSLHSPLGLSYIEAGEIAKAETSLQALDLAKIDDADTRLLRGLVMYKQNRNPEALAAFDRALELDSRSTVAQYHRGRALERMDQSARAIEAYKGAIAIDPTYAPASFELGVAYYNSGDYNSAATAYQNAIKYDADNAQAHANLASTYRQLERYPDANAEYKLASTGVKDPDLYSEWGYCLGQTNEWDKSVARLTTAKEMSPTAIDDSNLGWAYYNSANVQLAAKDESSANRDFALAKTHLQTAVQKDPRLDAAQLNLGSTHNALGEHQAAVDTLKIAVALRPKWGIALNQLGLGYRGLNDLTNAIAIFKSLVDMDGNNTLGLYNLGSSYFASGNKKEAKKINDKLKKLDPALAATLDNVIAGRVVDAARQKIEQKVPKVPKTPRLPF